MEFDEFARSADDAASRLIELGVRVGRVDTGASAYGSDGPGALGDLGAALAGLATAGRDARAAEARALGAAARDVALAVSRSAGGYRAIEDHRVSRVPGGPDLSRLAALRGPEA